MDEPEIEKAVISATSEKVKPKVASRRNSTGKPDAKKTPPSLPSSDGKFVPHYLRASTNSCHEHCKYGKEHVFEPKNRRPKFSRYPANTEVKHEDKTSKLRARRKVKNNLPEDKIPNESDVLDQEGQKDKQLLGSYEESESIKPMAQSPLHESIASSEYGGLFDTLEGESSEEESDSIKQMTLSTSHEGTVCRDQRPFSEHEGLSSIRTVIPSQENLPGMDMPYSNEAIELETPSPVEKNIVSHTPTPLTWSQGSSEESMSMQLEVPSPTCMSVNKVEGLPEVSSGAEVVETIKSPDEPSSETMKPKKLKAVSTNTQSSAYNKKQSGMKNLRTIEEDKKETVKLKSTTKAKTEAAAKGVATKGKKVEVAEKPNVIKKKNPLEKIKTSITPKLVEEGIQSSVTPRVVTKKVTVPVRKNDGPARSLSLKLKTPVAKTMSALISSPRTLKAKGVSPVKRTSSFLKSKTPILESPDKALKPSEALPVRQSQGKRIIKSRYLTEPSLDKALKPSRSSLSPKTTATGISRTKLAKHKSQTSTTSIESPLKGGKLSRTTEKVTELSLAKTKRTPRKNHEDGENILNEASGSGSKKSSSDNQRLRRTTTARSDEKHSSPHKLNFRRGKVLSPQSENSGPRKLRFRQATIIDSHSGKVVLRRRSFRRRGSIGSMTDLTAVASSETPPVVLRHQDVQEKEAQGLFNHVIEETASKLVESRKSKVKALVGAFETVISLQEGRMTPSH